MDINVEGLEGERILNALSYGHSVVLTANPKDLLGDSAIKRGVDSLIDLNPNLEIVAVSRYTNVLGVPEALVVFKERKKSLWEKILSRFSKKWNPF